MSSVELIKEPTEGLCLMIQFDLAKHTFFNILIFVKSIFRLINFSFVLGIFSDTILLAVAACEPKHSLLKDILPLAIKKVDKLCRCTEVHFNALHCICFSLKYTLTGEKMLQVVNIIHLINSKLHNYHW